MLPFLFYSKFIKICYGPYERRKTIQRPLLLLLKPMSSLKDGAQRVYSKKNNVPYAEVDHNSPYLIVNSVVSYPFPLQRERGGEGNISPIG
jgi:hypothetical protein